MITSYSEALLRPHNLGLVIVLNGYFDDSGSHEGAELTCMAGYVFEPDKAIDFEKAWLPILQSAHVEYFRSYECWNRLKQFSKFGIAERDAMFGDLARLTATYALQSFVASLKQSDYEKLLEHSPKMKTFIGGPFSVALIAILDLVGQWANATKYSGDIAYWFESSNPHQEEAGNFCAMISNNPELKSRYRMGGYGFYDKRKVVQLHTADLFAWEWQKNVLAVARDEKYRVDPFLKILLSGKLPIRNDMGQITMGIMSAVNAFYKIANKN